VKYDIFCGLFLGVGLDLIFKAKATSGGSDIVLWSSANIRACFCYGLEFQWIPGEGFKSIESKLDI